MIPGMRRVLLATVTVVALVAASFGVGWVVSGIDERTGVHHQPAAARLKPLPVPRVIIPNGPWADPHPPVAAPVRGVPAGGFFVDFFSALGVDLETGAFVVR